MKFENESLERVTLSHLTQYEFSQCIERQVSEIEALGSAVLTDETLNNLLATVKTASEDYSKSILKLQKSEFTSKLAELDSARAKAVVAYKQALLAYAYSEDEDEKTAYHQLWTLSNKYKGVQKLNYEAETTALKKMASEIESAKYKVSVAKLNLGSKITRIKTANDAFSTLFDTRNNETNNKEKLDTKLLRKALQGQYIQLVNYVATMANTFNKKPYNSVLKILNTVRRYYREILNRRKGVSNAKKAKTKTPTETNQ